MRNHCLFLSSLLPEQGYLPSAPSLLPGVQSVEVQLENQMVLVETTLPSQDVQALLESTGRQAVLKGMGSGLLGE